MRRAEVRLVDLDPARGAEANKRRPAVIVSNDAANRTATRLGGGVLTVVPVTSNVERVYPFQVLLASGTAGLTRDSKAQAEQVARSPSSASASSSGTSPPTSWRRSMTRCGFTSPSRLASAGKCHGQGQETPEKVGVQSLGLTREGDGINAFEHNFKEDL